MRKSGAYNPRRNEVDRPGSTIVLSSYVASSFSSFLVRRGRSSPSSSATELPCPRGPSPPSSSAEVAHHRAPPLPSSLAPRGPSPPSSSAEVAHHRAPPVLSSLVPEKSNFPFGTEISELHSPGVPSCHRHASDQTDPSFMARAFMTVGSFGLGGSFLGAPLFPVPSERYPLGPRTPRLVLSPLGVRHLDTSVRAPMPH